MGNKLKVKLNTYCILLFLCFIFKEGVSNSSIFSDTVLISDDKREIFIGRSIQILEDKTNKLTIEEAINSSNFHTSNQPVPNIGISNSSFWLRFKIKNITSEDQFLLELINPLLDEIEFYTIYSDKKYTVKKTGELEIFSKRKYDHPSYIFDLIIPRDSTCYYFLKIKSSEDMSLPIKLGTTISIMNSIRTKDLLFGLYSGIMIVMFLYNTFIYLTTRDKSYLYYIGYILFVTLTQICFQGYTFQFLWGNYPWIAKQSVILLSSFVGIGAGEFVKTFLNTKSSYPRLTKVLNIFYFSYLICIILSTIGINSTKLLNITALLISAFILFIAIKLANEGNRSAKFFIIAWLVFLIGVIVYALKNMGILPYNNLTIYTMPAGSAIEAILLSFALADRINILKKENEKLITDQNIVLEQKVEVRTLELNETLSNLKNTQAQLVNAEKMASLGQLTAGIAHEINNPINFVSANVKPLKMDIEDVLALVKKYETLTPDKITKNDFEEIEKFRKQIDIDYLKKEMESLLLGIEDGAKRTAEIVSGLKNFSRLDESDVKEVNINDGIESTLILLKSAVPPNTKIITHLSEIPIIECLPGKLNQVFMNLFSNALYAIKQKNSKDENSLTVSTYISGENVIVEIKDTGIGMTPEVKAKIFDPFFTTKDVGEGTGLGMSIVFKIIESHGAKILVESEYGVGTKILLILNKKINFTPAI